MGPCPLGGLGQIFVQQRLPPELPRATGPRQGAHKSPNIFTKILKKSRTELRSQNLIFDSNRYPWFPKGPWGPRDPQGPPGTPKNRFLPNFIKIIKNRQKIIFGPF